MRSLLLWAGLLLAVSFVPLFGGPRYETALFAGLVGPFWVALVSQRASLESIVEKELSEGTSILLRSLSVALSHVLVLFVIATAWGVADGFCEPGVGFGILALGPGFGMILAGLLGGAAALFAASLPQGTPRRLAGAVFATAAPLVSVFIGVLRFYESPSVYAYSPFVGYFSGPLYDTVNYDLERLSGYRGGTLLTCLAVSGVLVSLRVISSGDRLRVRFAERTKERVVLLVGAGAAALGSVAHSIAGDDMGYGSSTESIRSVLGRRLEKGACVVYFSRGVDELEASLVARECVGHLGQLARYFELGHVDPVDIYLFSGGEEKKQLMGAASTYIAKPWRREVYIQPAGFPHPVLGHELAHVVTGSFGRGPFRIAGHFGGWLPDPGRIEGFAEAASPKEHSEGTLHQWASAMRTLELMPPLSSLFQLSFLGSSPARAYAASGSFVDFLRTRSGAAALKDWYGGADLTAVAGASLSELEAEWYAFLAKVDVPERVLEMARPRFSRPGVFERRCPHAVDRLVQESLNLCPYQEAKARRLAEEAIAFDPTKKDLELRMERCGYYHGDAEQSRKGLTALSAQEAVYDPGARRSALDFAGNNAWATGDKAGARESFEAAQKLTYDIDTARNLEVKLWALQQAPEVEVPLRRLLSPRPTERKLPQVYLTEWLNAGPEEELARYLLARTLYEHHAEQADALVKGLSLEKLPLASLSEEGARMKLLSSCRQALNGGPISAVDGALEALLSMKPHEGRVFEAQRVAERCRLAAGETEKEN